MNHTDSTNVLISISANLYLQLLQSKHIIPHYCRSQNALSAMYTPPSCHTEISMVSLKHCKCVTYLWLDKVKAVAKQKIM